jgi:hypothetical protein
MSEDDYDDLHDDDVDILELDENLPNTGARAATFNDDLEARAATEEDAMSKAVGDKLYGPTGRGSPEMRNISPYELSRNSGKALRGEGIKDNRHLKNTKAWDTKTEQERKEEEEERQFDEAMSNMYKKMKKPVKSAVRTMSKAKLPPKKGGTRKRSSRKRSKKSSRVSRKRNKRSSRNKSRRRR